MGIISQYVYEQGLYGEWLPRYVLDHSAKTAFEFMDESHYVCIVDEEDFGVAEVIWQRTREAEGFDYVDEDGFGVGGNFELTRYGYIDKRGYVVGKFRRLGANDSRAYYRQLA